MSTDESDCGVGVSGDTGTGRVSVRTVGITFQRRVLTRFLTVKREIIKYTLSLVTRLISKSQSVWTQI